MFEYYRNLTNHPELSAEEFDEAVANFVAKLESLGIESFRIELLVDKFVSGFTYEEIATQHGFVSEHAVRRVVNQTLSTLKGMGMNLVEKRLTNE